MPDQQKILKTRHYKIIDGPDVGQLSSALHDGAFTRFRTDSDQKYTVKITSYQHTLIGAVHLLGYTGYIDNNNCWRQLWPFMAFYRPDSRTGQFSITMNCVAKFHPEES